MDKRNHFLPLASELLTICGTAYGFYLNKTRPPLQERERGLCLCLYSSAVSVMAVIVAPDLKRYFQGIIKSSNSKKIKL